MSEQWIVLLERMNELRERLGLVFSVLPDRAARQRAFDAAAAPLVEASREFGKDQQECIVMLIQELKVDHGLMHPDDLRE